MNNILKEYLLSLKFNNNEIENLLEKSPVLEFVSADEAIEILGAIVDFGYPEDDLTYLISQNPGVLARTRESLISDLQKIKKTYGDIEEALKNNPFLI